MSRPIYVPIADSFFESSIMHEDLTVRFVMLGLIRLGLRSGANGEIDIDPRIFAKTLNLPFEDVERAIKRLMEPDPLSSSPDEDGRRIIPIDPARPARNWRLVNWGRYSDIVHRANDAARKRDQRAHAKKDITDGMDASENVQKRPDLSESVRERPQTALRNTKNEERRTKNDREREREHFVPPTLEEAKNFFEEEKLSGDAEAFYYHFEATGWVAGKTKLKSWKAAAHKWSRREGEFVARKPVEARTASGASIAPSGDVRLPTGGYAAADRSWFDYKGSRYFEGKPGVYRDAEGYAPDGTHKQNTVYGDGAKEIAERILAAVPKP